MREYNAESSKQGRKRFNSIVKTINFSYLTIIYPSCLVKTCVVLDSLGSISMLFWTAPIKICTERIYIYEISEFNKSKKIETHKIVNIFANLQLKQKCLLNFGTPDGGI